ncbi:SRPBCC domain-containing protein [Streptomyces sp. NBC_00876]|uniref:SRPBCC domain-containing protein n=1 Tax=Streptomyces sp. NBC_00876 TaxID=2975853 RepID=UPI00386D481F|nr:SRPBCC domain-containing protein [Streptomyces sp. NBC_00876]
MEHEVFVPVPVPALRRTLSDPVRVARCVPGLQQDADASAGPLSGRLKVRAGGHTITYRGVLRLTPLPGGPDADHAYGVSVTGEGVEARGGGSAELALTLRLAERDGGTAIAFEGTVSGDGRLVELEPAAALSAAHRLLDRFTQQLVTESLAAPEGADRAGPVAGADADAEADAEAEAEADADAEADAEAAGTAVAAEELAVGEAVEKALEEAAEESDQTGPGPSAGADEAPPTHEAAADEAPAGEPQTGSPAGEPQPGKDSLFDTPVPPPALDPVAGIEFTVPDVPPAEAAHARRTMIGRSAEEVDHAPPRGRYAPVPSPESTGAGATLRWVAPAAALALASAVVVGRALRRRR